VIQRNIYTIEKNDFKECLSFFNLENIKEHFYWLAVSKLPKSIYDLLALDRLNQNERIWKSLWLFPGK
jgi:hypothetical protein